MHKFAGGGGASTGIEMALERSPNFAINHDPEAIAFQEAPPILLLIVFSQVIQTL
jgi:site-specific DNA-cytosine methylase